MACDKQILSPYLDNELSVDAKIAQQRHLEQCAPCREELNRLARTQTAVHLLLEMPAFDDQVMAKLEAEAARLNTRKLIRRGLALATLFLGILAATAAYRYLPTQPTDGPQLVEKQPQQATPDNAIETVATKASSAPTTATEEATITETDELPLLLAHTTTGYNPLAFIIAIKDNTQGTYSKGDTVWQDWTLETIAEDYVALEQQSERRILTLEDDNSLFKPASLDGFWWMRFSQNGEGPPPDQMKLSQRGQSFFLTTPGNDTMARGKITHNSISASFMPDSPRAFDVAGDLNRAHTDITLAGMMELEGEEPTEIKMLLSKMSNQQTQQREQIAKQLPLYEEEMETLFDALIEYREAHENEFPQRLDLLVPDYISAKNLARLTERNLVYRPEDVRTAAPPLESLWTDFRQDLPIPDRILAFEAAVRMSFGGNLLRPSPILSAHFTNPDVEIVASLGGVHVVGETLLDQSSPEDDESPVVSEAQALAHLESCQNNLKQLGIINHMFWNENQDYTTGGFAMVVPEYLSDVNILNCPADPDFTESYQLLFPGTHRDFLEELAESIESTPGSNPGIGSIPLVTETHTHTINGEQRSNVLFVDGHVTAIHIDEWDQRITPYLQQ